MSNDGEVNLLSNIIKQLESLQDVVRNDNKRYVDVIEKVTSGANVESTQKLLGLTTQYKALKVKITSEQSRLGDLEQIIKTGESDRSKLDGAAQGLIKADTEKANNLIAKYEAVILVCKKLVKDSAKGSSQEAVEAAINELD